MIWFGKTVLRAAKRKCPQQSSAYEEGIQCMVIGLVKCLLRSVAIKKSNFHFKKIHRLAL